MTEFIVYTLVFGVVIAIVFLTIKGMIYDGKSIQRNFDRLMGDRNVSKRYFSKSKQVSAIVLDEEKQEICILQDLKYKGEISTYRFEEILDCEVIVDDKTITKTSRSSQIAGMAVGGVLLGGVGAVVGGLSARKTSSNKVQNINLRIIVANTAKPIHEINFLSAGSQGLDKDSEIVKRSMKDANDWHALLAFVIKRFDASNPIASDSESTIADELSKLADLRDRKILTDDEFNSQKEKLLSR